MALDIHRWDNDEFLFAIQHEQFNELEDIFAMFAQWIGLVVDEYNDIDNRKSENTNPRDW